MSNPSAVTIFIVAASLLTASSLTDFPSTAQSTSVMKDMKEWTTDMDIDANSEPDQNASKSVKSTEDNDVCVPIGEGENCW